MSLNLTSKQLELIERLGVMTEGSGLQPAAARITALLLIADKTELTFDEIRETLNLSKSATSNALNLLINIQRIDFITKPGDRKRYFRSNIGHWRCNITEKFEEMNKAQILLREILDQRTNETPEFNRNLEEMIDLTGFIFSELPGIIQRWEERKKNK